MNKTISFVFIITLATVVAITSIVVNTQSVMAIVIGPCSPCAKDLAPGQLSKNSKIGQDAKFFAPGQEAKIPVTCMLCNGKDFAPGQLKKQSSVVGK